MDLFFAKCYSIEKGGEDMVRVHDVARWFLSQSSMTHKKVQKLCYYAQAWHCALYNQPLFAEAIQAWVHGPVIPALYPTYADYGWQNIPQQPFDETLLEEDAISILNAVYTTYGHFSGDQLESLTHSEDPWIIARGDLRPWESCTKAISFEDMRSYYSRKYQESQND